MEFDHDAKAGEGCALSAHGGRDAAVRAAEMLDIPSLRRQDAPTISGADSLGDTCRFLHGSGGLQLRLSPKGAAQVRATRASRARRATDATRSALCGFSRARSRSQVRDALAKELYSRLFSWLVDRVNVATCESRDAAAAAGAHARGEIGLLDIFGFEKLERNGLEQFLINYTNETLQQKFCQDVFKSVQSEYESEGIPLVR